VFTSFQAIEVWAGIITPKSLKNVAVEKAPEVGFTYSKTG
jgi:hypothetical protein